MYIKWGNNFLDIQWRDRSCNLVNFAYYMSKKQWSILYSNLLYKMGHYFLDRRYKCTVQGVNAELQMFTELLWSKLFTSIFVNKFVIFHMETKVLKTQITKFHFHTFCLQKQWDWYSMVVYSLYSYRNYNIFLANIMNPSKY